MEELLGALLEILLEVIGEFLIQLLFELLAEVLGELINRWRQGGPVVSAIGLIAGGAAAGLLSAWLIPHRLIATRVIFPGVSLLLAPLATGGAMWSLGKRLRQRGRTPSNLATFGGGALFAFAMALIRWWLVR